MRRILKPVSISLIFILLFELGFPIAAHALTGGPSQPEVQSFEPVGTTEMVDLFTGDFNYNIPLLDVEGYPINLAYHSGISMDQEASWVGLGWNINPGVINRNMRGIPDEFAGDEIKKTMSLLPDKTWGTKVGMGFELFGVNSKGKKIGSMDLSFGFGQFYNTYRGMGYEMSLNPTFGIAGKNKHGLTAGLGLSANSQSGLGVNPSIGLGMRVMGEKDGTYGKLGFSVSGGFNSRSGLKTLNLGYGLSAQNDNAAIKKGKLQGQTTEASVNVLNNSSSISFGTQSYTPQLGMPMQNTSLSFRGTVGAYINGPDGFVYVEGYHTSQQLAGKNSSKKAYGYLNSEQSKGATNGDVLLDFNREKDGVFTENSTNLAVTNYTYDLYNVSGQGVGGMYRPYRSDIGILHDDYTQNNSGGGSLGAELAVPTIVHFGADINVNYSESHSGVWLPEYTGLLDFQSTNYAKSPLYEPAYFKNVGEKTPSDVAFYNGFHAEKPMRMGINKKNTGKLSGNFIFNHSDESESSPNQAPIYQSGDHYTKAKRDKRNQSIQLLSGEHADGHALESTIRSYTPNSWYVNGSLPYTSINRSSNYRQPHHTTEITALNPDGTRYVYGIPAYNTKQVEGSFSVDDNNANYNSGQIIYDPTDRSTGNTKGIENFYSRTELPAYTHSYLVTGVLSPDYVDVTGNGITDDDLGTAVKINYSRVDSVYHWRVPYLHRSANFEEGSKTNKKDGRGSYLYGEKELWYVQSIESKNFIAVFELLSDRLDGHGVIGEDGDINIMDPTYYLRSITLYAKQDFRNFGSNATPIKKVHFRYNNKLCRKLDNNVRTTNPNINTDTTIYNESGKLALTKVWFTYGKSFEGELSSYEFTYSSFNPDYNLKGYDRWGNYKPNLANANGSGPLSNAEFPYVDQDDRINKADKYAQAWTLTKIDLPSGGTIKVEYECDDYAYVQDKTAMQMFKIAGFNSSTDHTTISNELYKSTDDDNTSRNYVFIDLPTALTGSDARDKLFDRYIKGLDHLYFNCLTDITTGGKYEYVRGYAEFDYNDNPSDPPYGVVASGTKAWIRLRTPFVGDKRKGKKINPIAKTAWQFAKLHTPELIYPGSNTNVTGHSDEAIIRSLVGFAMDMKSFVKGFNSTMHGNGYGRTVETSKSWVRLNCPTRMKLGGGSRVKKIALSDNWGTRGKGASSADDYEYGQVYSYTTTQKVGAYELTISSGVAAYEPMVGNDENPWRQPIFTTTENRFFPDESHYTETPYGESFFPAPVVGYSKVVVKNIPRTNVKRTATGYTVEEFYTAKDYPTLVYETALKKQPNRGKLLKILGLTGKDFVTASQGYTIELNDMHGKPKRKRVYQEGETNKDKFISGVEYSYFTDQAYNFDETKPYHLQNTVTLINRSNQIYDGMVGVDMDACVDMRQQESKTWGAGLAFNSENITLGILALSLPMLIPNYSKEHVRFNSSVVTKVVNRYGILQKVTAYEDGSMVSTENLAFDGETGEVLLTRTQNEFHDTIYNFTYPAHWAYDNMGSAAVNVGAKFSGVRLGMDTIHLQNGLYARDFFVPGDEVWTNSTSSSMKRLWVYRNNNGKLKFIKKDGTSALHGATPGLDMVIIRSGRRNMQTVPIGTVTTLTNPIKGTGSNRYLSFSASTKVLNAAALEFSDKWTKQCAFVQTQYCDSVTNIGKDILYLVNAIGYAGNLEHGASGLLTDYAAYNSSTELKNFTTKPEAQGGIGCTTHAYSVSVSNNLFSQTSTLSISWDPSCERECAIGLTADVINFPFDSIVSSHVYAEPHPGGFNQMYIGVKMGDGSTRVLTLSFDCAQLMKCYNNCELRNEGIVNPYQTGIRGTWHKTKDYVYLDDRNYNSAGAKPRSDGLYSTFTPFWNYASNKWSPSNHQNWTWASEVTKVSRTGVDVENKDALNRFTAAIYGFNFSLPIAVASNSKYRQIAYDGFEDYSYSTGTCGQYQFNFTGVSNANLDSTIKHTGRKSIKLTTGTSVTANRQLYYCEQKTSDSDKYVYRVKPCDCIGLFSPDTGNYIVGAWVKVDTSAYAKSYGGKIEIDLIQGASHTYYTFRPSGPIIDGWQRIEGKFYLPNAMTSISVRLYSSSNHTTWFDDVRIHPFDGNMKSYAYDNKSLRLMAELDENNYATFYEYDKSGSLIRVKKETVKGVMTLQENRSSILKR